MAEVGMVERVARVIEARIVDGLMPGASPVPIEAVARSVIEAMREPTQGMITGAGWSREASAHIWRALIDAALADG